MALRTARRLVVRGRPPGRAAGRTGATKAHAASVSQCDLHLVPKQSRLIMKGYPFERKQCDYDNQKITHLRPVGPSAARAARINPRSLDCL